MAADIRITQAVAKAALDTIVDSIDTGGAGTIKFYTGTIPTNANTAVGAQTLLATLTFSATAFGAATTADPSVATAASITSDTDIDASGTATWARILNGSGTTIADLTVGTSGEDINLNTNVLVQHAVLALTSLTITQPLT